MPLVRYEVRCEHSLANPELYRTAIQDDSEGLLEGVAMAGLVGLVRQLGDLAEFAAEIFHDLHDDIVKIVSRSQNAQSRVTRLEADLPVVEKALLAKASQFRFAYTTRSKWRAPLPMDQNLCTHGELPRFVRNFYDDCRGPPRLFLLDKFDGDGRGACEKRYTDPTFFRLTWVTSQLEKAEQLERERKEQLDLQAEQEKKSSMRKTSKYVYPRERLSSAHFENLEGFTGDFTPELRSMRLGQVLEGGNLTPDEPQSPEGTQSKRRQQRPVVDQGPALAPLKVSAEDIENAKRGRRMPPPTTSDEEEASEYVDAVTTMPSDVNSEHNRWSAQKSAETQNRKSVSPKHSPLKASNEVQHQSPSLEQDQHDEFARRRFDPEISSPTAIELERQPESHKNITNDEVLLNGHAKSPKLPEPVYDSVSVVDVFSSRGEDPGVPVAARDLSKDATPQATPEETMTAANVEQPVTTPRGRRQWARDNGSSSSIMLSMVDVDGNEDLDFRARSVDNTGALGLVGEEQRGGGFELLHRSSSNASSPYTNISSSEEDGFTSESASSSPKRGPNFCTLLSPPESPPRRLVGSANAHSGRSSPRAPPPITPFLSASPSVSRSSSKKNDSSSAEKPPQNHLDQARPSPLVPRRSSLFPQTSNFAVANSAESSEKIKEILVTEPRRTRENGGLEPSRSQDQTSNLPNLVARPRTWVDRSESNVAATLHAIRQAAAVESDDDTGSEHRSDR